MEKGKAQASAWWCEGAYTLQVQQGVQFDWSERSVVVDRCDWGDWSGEPDQEMACKLRNLDFILKAFGSL